MQPKVCEKPQNRTLFITQAQIGRDGTGKQSVQDLRKEFGSYFGLVIVQVLLNNRALIAVRSIVNCYHFLRI